MHRRILLLILAIVSPVMFGRFAGVSSVYGQGGPITQGPVTDLWNTGVDSSGIVLPNDTVPDPHYTLVSAPGGSSTTLVTATSVGGTPIPPWLPDDSESTWIGPGLDYTGVNYQLQTPAIPGNYDYQTTFNLSVAGPVLITGEWSADNHGYDILLDGNSTGNSTTPSTDYTYWSAFTISGTGVAGANTLDFLVDKNTTSPVYTGLRVEFTSVPEPSTLALLSAGVIALLGCAWRRRKQIGI